MPTTVNYRADNSSSPGEHPIHAFAPGEYKGTDWLSEKAANIDIIASKGGDFANAVKKSKAVTVAFYHYMAKPKYVEGDDIKMLRLLIYDPSAGKDQSQATRQILFPKAKVKRSRIVEERDPFSSKVPAKYREVVFTVSGLDVYPPK